MNEEVLNAIAKSLNIEPTQFVASVKGEGDTIDPSKLSETIGTTFEKAIQHTKEKEKEVYTNLLGKSKKEWMSDREKRLREAAAIEEGLEGDELINAVQERIKSLQDASVSPDKWKTHPEFIKAVSEAESRGKQTVAEQLEAIKNEYERFKTETTQAQVFAKVKDAALSKFSTLNMVDVSDEIKSEWGKLVLDKLRGYNYTEVEDSIFLLDEKGEVLKDKFGNTVPFDSVVTDALKFIPLKASDSRGGRGNGGQSNDGKVEWPDNYKGTRELPKSLAEVDVFRAKVLQDLQLKKISYEDVQVAFKNLESIKPDLK